MSELEIPGQARSRKIALQTRCCHDIDNLQVRDLSKQQLKLLPDYSKRFPSVKFRTGPNPYYNCIGMTFGSARTSIGMEVIPMILHDDGYKMINQDCVLPGDVVLYYDENEQITHSGVIVSDPSREVGKIPWVVSKWGQLGEAYHHLRDCPYDFHRVEYWRILDWQS